MTNRRIEIDVVLNTEQVDKGFDDIEKGGVKVGETFQGVGETFSGIGSTVSSMGDEATQALGGVGESAAGAVGAVVGLGQAATTTGASFSAMLGPIGLVAVAIFEAVKAWGEYKDEVNGVNTRHDAYIASTSELTAALEELATNQVNLSRAEVERLQSASMNAKLDIETAQTIREKNAEIDKSIYRLNIQIKQEKEALAQKKLTLKTDERLGNNAQLYAVHLQAIGNAEKQLETKLKAREKLQAKLIKREQEAIDRGLKGSQNFAKFEALKEGLLRKAPKFREELAEKEKRLDEDSQLAILQLAGSTQDSLTKIARIGSERRIREINALEFANEQVRANAIKSERVRLETELEQIAAAAEAKREQKRRLDYAKYKARLAKRRAEEQKQQNELRSIQSLEIDRAEIIGADQMDIINRRYELERDAAQGNKNKLLAIDLKFQNQLLKINRDAQKQRAADEAASAAKANQLAIQQAEHRKQFIFSSLEFDAQMLEAGVDKELRLIELKYKKEIELGKHSQEEITELQRREAIERKRIRDRSFQDQFVQLEEMGKSIASAGASAAYGAIVAGEGFKDAVGQSIFALGQQASVQALFASAQAIGFLAQGNFAAAALKGKAAAAYGTAAVIAGVTANRLGVGGGGSGGGGGGGGASSPTGQPQSTTPQREQAQEQAIVYNINFGGSVIYDTRTAAEQAFASRLTQLQNRTPRGGARPRSRV